MEKAIIKGGIQNETQKGVAAYAGSIVIGRVMQDCISRANPD